LKEEKNNKGKEKWQYMTLLTLVAPYISYSNLSQEKQQQQRFGIKKKSIKILEVRITELQLQLRVKIGVKSSHSRT